MRHAFLMPGGAASFGWIGLTLTIVAGLVACSDKGSSDLASEQASVTSVAWAETEQPPVSEEVEEVSTLDATGETWTPEALENLLAPVALYPDVVLAQVLVASTNPQEVLDAGNWILENTALQDESLDKAAQEAGFTVPMRSLIQFPEVVDMMCQDLDWTSELGQAYVNDQAGVLDAAQRLRVQAQDVGNLQTSDQMKVETVTQDNQQVVTISPPSTQVVYVPQYDPVAVYAPAPVVTATTTTTVVEDKGYSSGDMVMTGLLAFGAGMLVNEIISDNNDYYRGGGYWGRPPPYYAPYPYRPRYGNGFYPSNGYNRGNVNFNNNITVNQNNNYWKNRKTGNDRSPISDARNNRPELNSLNAQAAKGPRRSAPGRSSLNTGDRARAQGSLAGATASRPEGGGGGNLPKVQGSYAGSKPAANRTQGAVAAVKPGGAGAQRESSKVKGSYAGARPSSASTSSRVTDRGRTSSGTRPQAKPHVPSNSGGRLGEKPRQTHSANQSSGSRRSALSGSNRGGSAHAASNRGRKSMQHSSASKGGRSGRSRR
jgi:hypothetical protein